MDSPSPPKGVPPVYPARTTPSLILTNSAFSTDPASLDPALLAGVRTITRGVLSGVHSMEERRDYFQELLVRFWETERQYPGESLSWYLSRCRWFLRDLLRRGRSLDSPKRRRLCCSLGHNDTIETQLLDPALICEINPRQQAAISDDLAQIRLRLQPRDQMVLKLFLQDCGACEVARNLELSPSVISDSRGRIRTVALQIGLRPSACRVVTKKSALK